MSKEMRHSVPSEVRFEFTSPVNGAHVGENFTVRGICNYLKIQNDLQITVKYTRGASTWSSIAVTSPIDCTFEANFYTMPTGTGRVTAEANVNELPPPITDVTVDG